MSGEMDLMSTNDDIYEQKKRLNAFVTEIVYQQYGHMDFVWVS